MDHLMRAYGSLAAEIDPEDRLKLLSQGARRNSRNEPTLWKAARRLESDAGEAPSRDARDPPIKSLPMQPVPAPPKAIPPQVLGKAEELPLNPVPATVQQSGPSHWGSTVSDTLMRHIELPPKLPDLPVVESDSESSEDEVTSEKERTDRNAKFDALDAELTEQLNQSSGFTLDVSSLHASIEGLPKRKTLKRQGSGKDRKGKESQGPRAPKASKAPKGPGTGVSRVQHEFARLEMTNVVVSTRSSHVLAQGGFVDGWDDPRMPTISGMRRRGYPPSALRKMCELVGVPTSVIEFGLLENCVREALQALLEAEPHLFPGEEAGDFLDALTPNSCKELSVKLSDQLILVKSPTLQAG
eukprot:Skav235556  [mRNA]  locus=scaffold3067:304710:317617:- [translate_table: standard]